MRVTAADVIILLVNKSKTCRFRGGARGRGGGGVKERGEGLLGSPLSALKGNVLLFWDTRDDDEEEEVRKIEVEVR